MDFRALLLEADKNQKVAAKQSQQVKRINTHFTTPAKREEKSGQPKSETLQKLLREKELEKQQQRERAEQERRQKEKEERNAFRIPKKKVVEDPVSEAESFSSISSEDEAADPDDSWMAKMLSGKGSAESSSIHVSGSKTEGSHRDKSKHSSSSKSLKNSSSSSHGSSSSHKSSSKDDNHHHSKSSKDSLSSEKHKSSSSHKSEHSTSEDQKHSSSSSDKHRHSHEKHQSSSSREKHKSGSGGDKHKSDSGSSRDKHKASSSGEKHRSSSDKDKHGKSSSDSKHKSSSSKDHKSSSSKTSDHRGSHTSSKDKSHTSSSRRSDHKDKPSSSAENYSSSGYVTSPDISSDEGEDSTSKAQVSQSSGKTEEAVDLPVTLNRHHLKPTIERKGCSLEERNRVLAKLAAIRDKLYHDDDKVAYKRAARGDVKKRRAKREKLDGDFTGSCMEKVDYDEEEKPSLKRPEPKPEEPKPEKQPKKKKLFSENSDRKDRHKEKSSHKSSGGKLHSISKSSHKSSGGKLHSISNRFDAMSEKKEKIKPKKIRPISRPPPLNFADLMKIAEKKQAEPVMVEVAPKKKEKEKRPMTQEEIDRKQARTDRLKTKEYKDWYKFGEGKADADAKSDNTKAKDSQSGGFLHSEHQVIPSSSSSSGHSSKPGSTPIPRIPRKDPPTTSASNPSSAPAGRPAPGFKPQPHPTRPGMIANKPMAMAQHFNDDRRTSSDPAPPTKKRARSPDAERASRPPPTQSSKPAAVRPAGNAWDNLFTRPEYKKMKDPGAAKKRKMVIDSEEEEDYDDDMDDFIDDEGEEDMESVSGAIKQLFGYDKRRYRDEDDDDMDMEVGFSQIMKEEARSARLGREEDLEDMRKEAEELRLKALKKKKMSR